MNTDIAKIVRAAYMDLNPIFRNICRQNNYFVTRIIADDPSYLYAEYNTDFTPKTAYVTIVDMESKQEMDDWEKFQDKSFELYNMFCGLKHYRC